MVSGETVSSLNKIKLLNCEMCLVSLLKYFSSNTFIIKFIIHDYYPP